MNIKNQIMISVRHATPLDFETIAGFQVRMARETENISLDPETVTRGVKRVFAKPDLGKYYVAEVNDKVIASLLTTYEWSDWRNGTVLWIQSVFVEPAYRNKGVFRMMYEKVQQVVLENETFLGIRLYVDKSNHPAQKVYNKLGMNGDHYLLFEWMK